MSYLRSDHKQLAQPHQHQHRLDAAFKKLDDLGFGRDSLAGEVNSLYTLPDALVGFVKPPSILSSSEI